MTNHARPGPAPQVAFATDAELLADGVMVPAAALDAVLNFIGSLVDHGGGNPIAALAHAPLLRAALDHRDPSAQVAALRRLLPDDRLHTVVFEDDGIAQCGRLARFGTPGFDHDGVPQGATTDNACPDCIAANLAALALHETPPERRGRA